MWRMMLTALTVVLTLLLLALWFLFFTGLRWRTRLLGLGAAIVVAIGIGVLLDQLLRQEGSSNGSGLPSYTWKWTPPKDAALPELKLAASETRVDLTATTPDDFPQFLGPERNGVVHGVRLARDWSVNRPQEQWRRPIGLGWSAFAVFGKHAVTQEQRRDQELVVCYNLLTGDPEWIHANPVRFSEQMGGDGPRATPTIAGGRVYTLGATGILDCLDGSTGKPIWSRDVLKEFHGKNLIWGKSASPLIVDNLVVVNGVESGGPSVAAYDKETGEPAWHAGEDRSSYSSATLATLAGKRQILMVNGGSVTAHDPKDGHILWDFSWPGEMAKCSQPVPLEGDRVFLSTGYGIGCTMLHIEADGDQLSAKQVWSNQNLRTQFSNVLIRDGYAYGLDERILVCLDLRTGQRKWKDGRYDYGQVLLVDDLILVQAEKGEVALVEAKPEAFHELGRIKALSSKTWNNPVLAGRYLLVRNDQEAACYELVLETASPK
jgi:outer membrane protein assembly factor BamB